MASNGGCFSAIIVQRHHCNDTFDDHFVRSFHGHCSRCSTDPVLESSGSSANLPAFYVWVIRGTPLLVQLYVVFFGLPSIGIMVDAFLAAVIVFSINEGAYNAETIRGALESVPQGQMEAGRCVGLNYFQIMWHVVLPQAFRTAFPALGNSMISMVKDTSLAANITVAEMFFQAQRIAGRTYETMAVYIEVALIYLIFSTILEYLQRRGEKKLGKYGTN